MTYIKEMFLKYYEKGICFMCVVVATPLIFLLEMLVVRPKIIEVYHIGVTQQYLHLICPTICFINVAGNMCMSILTDTRLRNSHADGTYCEHCQLHQPAGSWHCAACNACILRRDHHCIYLSRCIGLRNQRYYVSCLGYLAISMVYCFYYNYYFVSLLFEDYGLFLSTFRILNPLLRFAGPEPMGVRDLCLLLLMMNFLLVFATSALFFFHMCNVFIGVTSRERKNVSLFCLEWSKCRENMIQVYGRRWLLAMICPFVCSLPPESVKVE